MIFTKLNEALITKKIFELFLLLQNSIHLFIKTFLKVSTSKDKNKFFPYNFKSFIPRFAFFSKSCLWMLLWYVMTSSTPNYRTLKAFKSQFLFYFNEVGFLSFVKWLIYLNPLGLPLVELPFSSLQIKNGKRTAARYWFHATVWKLLIYDG